MSGLDLDGKELVCIIHAAEMYREARAVANKPTSIIDGAIAKLRAAMSDQPGATGAALALDVLSTLNGPSFDCRQGVHIYHSEGGPCVKCGKSKPRSS